MPVSVVLWLMRYALLVTTSIVCWPFMHLFNRTVIIGRENMPRRKNLLLIANHATMIDSWFIGMAAYFPWIILKPELQPYHLPEEKNFCKGPLLTVLCRLWRCIPINRTTGDFVQKPIIMRALRKAGLIIFPQGTRDRQAARGIITEWKMGGIRRLVQECDPVVVPIGIYGMHEVLPIGTSRFRCGKVTVVAIGTPFTCTDGLTLKRSEFDAVIGERTKKAAQHALDVAHARWDEEIKRPSFLLRFFKCFELLLEGQRRIY